METILTEEFQKVIDLVEDTNDSILVTGKAGCGKTTLLKYLVENLDVKEAIVVAPTGVAAVNAGGATIHKQFMLPIGVLSYDELKKKRMPSHLADVLRTIDVLIIDEISMVRADMMDAIDYRLRRERHNEDPFGGVQVVMFGDLYQLAPVVRTEEKIALNARYGTNYNFFNAKVFQDAAGFHVVELTHIFRQSDPQFIDLLNHVRDYTVTEEELDLLSECVNIKKANEVDAKTLHLATHRDIVDKINTTQLGEPEREYKAEFKGNFPTSSCSCDETLKLRVGARIMMRVNNKGFYHNGTLGEVVALQDNTITIKTDDGITATISRHTWKNYGYKVVKNETDGVATTTIEKEEIGSCRQFPVSLAWAVTVHKAQGLTFDNVILHVKRIFAAGQLYVALSRCRTLQGITLDCYVTRRMIRKDEDLKAFEHEYTRRGGKYGII